MIDLKAELVDLARRQGFLDVAVAAAEEDREARAITLERVRAGSFAGLPWFDEARVVRATDPRAHAARGALGRDARGVLLETVRPGAAKAGSAVAWRGMPGAATIIACSRSGRGPSLVFSPSACRASAIGLLVDHGPLAERAYARAAGLGWQGKNTMLLTRGVGSYTFLAAILTTVALEPDPPATQSCGACTRCLPACPTGALRSEYELVNDLCIAHHTIENRGPIPRALRPRWVTGSSAAISARKPAR